MLTQPTSMAYLHALATHMPHAARKVLMEETPGQILTRPEYIELTTRALINADGTLTTTGEDLKNHLETHLE